MRQHEAPVLAWVAINVYRLTAATDELDLLFEESAKFHHADARTDAAIAFMASRPIPRMVLASASQKVQNARGLSALPGRSANHAAVIAAPEGRVLVREHIGLHVADCRVGLVPDAVVECLDDVFLEVLRA